MSHLRVAINTGQLSQPVPGGIGRYVRHLVEGLPGVGVDVVAFGPTRAHALVYERWHRLRMIRARGIPSRGVPHGGGALDAVHAPSLAVAPPGRHRLIVTVHDLVFERFPETLTPRGVAFHRRGLELARREAANIIVPSAFVAGELTAAGFPAERITVIHHGVRVPPAPSQAVIDVVLGRLRVQEPFVLAVGTIEPRKGFDTLAEAMGRLRARHRDISLVVVGAAGWGEVSGLEDVRHRLVGVVNDSDLDVLYRRAAAFAFPSRYEGFGFPVLEALARGCPVVATDAASIPEVAGDAAVLIPSDDAAALAGALTDLLDDEAARRDLADRGLAQAGRFSLETSLRAHREVYEAHS